MRQILQIWVSVLENDNVWAIAIGDGLIGLRGLT